MAPIVIALLLSTAWIMASSAGAVGAAGAGAPGASTVLANWPLWLTAIVSGLVFWRTRIHLLWLLAAGAVLGALGLI
jgi:chromate transporter